MFAFFSPVIAYLSFVPSSSPGTIGTDVLPIFLSNIQKPVSLASCQVGIRKIMLPLLLNLGTAKSLIHYRCFHHFKVFREYIDLALE